MLRSGEQAEPTSLVRELNDKVRKALPFSVDGSKLVVSSGLAVLGIERVTQLVELVRDFSEFTPENDPYGEHDFGSIVLGPHRYFWKNRLL